MFGRSHINSIVSFSEAEQFIFAARRHAGPPEANPSLISQHEDDRGLFQVCKKSAISDLPRFQRHADWFVLPFSPEHYGGRGGGLSGEQEPVDMAVPHAENRLGASRGPTRRARHAGPADRRGARVPGGLEQQPGYPAAAGRCGDPDSLVRQAFGAAWRREQPPDWRLDRAVGVSQAFCIVHDSSSDRAVRQTAIPSAPGRRGW